MKTQFLRTYLLVLFSVLFVTANAQIPDYIPPNPDSVNINVIVGSGASKHVEQVKSGQLTKNKLNFADTAKISSNSTYVISTIGGIFTANSRVGSNLPSYTSSDAYTVIQSAINSIRGNGQGTGGGSIHLSKGLYNLSDELVINGWEGGVLNVTSQIKITGDGFATKLIQSTPNKNGIVVKNGVSFAFRDFYIYTNSASKSCLIADNTGSNTDMSCIRSLIDNVFFQSSSTSSPAVYLKNFFELSVPTALFDNGANDGLILETTSTSSSYGACNFGFIKCMGSNSSPFAGLRILSSNTNFTNCLTFGHVMVYGAYYGIYSKGLKFATFSAVDLEESQYSVYFIGGTSGFADETQGVNILGGYILPRAGGTGIYNSIESSGNKFTNLFIDGDATSIPIKDLQQFRWSNSYDIITSAALAAKISITTSTTTPLIVRKPGTPTNILPVGSLLGGSPSTSDNSNNIATTAYVTNKIASLPTSTGDAMTGKRISYAEATGGSANAVHFLGLSYNAQGTATARTQGTTSYYTRSRRVGYVSATTANAKAGFIGGPQFTKEEGYIAKFVFGINAYNAGHSYLIGMIPSIVGGQPSAELDMILMYADAGDTNFKIRGSNNTSGAVIDLGPNFPCNTSATDVYEFVITVLPGASTATYSVKRLNTGNTATGTINTIHSAGIVVRPNIVANNYATGVAANVDIMRVLIATDN